MHCPYQSKSRSYICYARPSFNPICSSQPTLERRTTRLTGRKESTSRKLLCSPLLCWLATSLWRRIWLLPLGMLALILLLTVGSMVVAAVARLVTAVVLQWWVREEKYFVGRRRHTKTEVAKPHVTKTLRKGGKHFRMIIIRYQ